MKLWKKNGRILRDGDGKPLKCNDCPCDTEPECDCDCDEHAQECVLSVTVPEIPEQQATPSPLFIADITPPPCDATLKIIAGSVHGQLMLTKTDGTVLSTATPDEDTGYTVLTYVIACLKKTKLWLVPTAETMYATDIRLAKLYFCRCEQCINTPVYRIEDEIDVRANIGRTESAWIQDRGEYDDGLYYAEGIVPEAEGYIEIEASDDGCTNIEDIQVEITKVIITADCYLYCENVQNPWENTVITKRPIHITQITVHGIEKTRTKIRLNVTWPRCVIPEALQYKGQIFEQWGEQWLCLGRDFEVPVVLTFEMNIKITGIKHSHREPDDGFSYSGTDYHAYTSRFGNFIESTSSILDYNSKITVTRLDDQEFD